MCGFFRNKINSFERRNLYEVDVEFRHTNNFLSRLLETHKNTIYWLLWDFTNSSSLPALGYDLHAVSTIFEISSTGKSFEMESDSV